MERDTDGDEGRKAGTETLEERHDETGMGQERQAGQAQVLSSHAPAGPSSCQSVGPLLWLSDS